MITDVGQVTAQSKMWDGIKVAQSEEDVRGRWVRNWVGTVFMQR